GRCRGGGRGGGLAPAGVPARPIGASPARCSSVVNSEVGATASSSRHHRLATCPLSPQRSNSGTRSGNLPVRAASPPHPYSLADHIRARFGGKLPQGSLGTEHPSISAAMIRAELSAPLVSIATG